MIHPAVMRDDPEIIKNKTKPEICGLRKGTGLNDRVIPARINADSLCKLSGEFHGIFIFHVHGGENLKIPDT
jgi:hypothetical protein